VGLHGIDAWRDTGSAEQEAARISSASGKPVLGARIHWLYFNSGSHEALERAGMAYDSTFGYNFAVGFRAGTAQAYRPRGAGDLLELPLLIQDTTMFYPSRMDLSEQEAFVLCRNILEDVSVFGGALVVNWHDRSLAPERLWGDFYLKLLREIKSRRVWFATAGEAAHWFQKRRHVQFDTVLCAENGLKVTLANLENHREGGLPLSIRTCGGKYSSFHDVEATLQELTIA
jgi:hypothetical protein